MIEKALHERVLFRLIEEDEKKTLIGLESGELQKIEILHWGLNRDGSDYPNFGSHAYIKRDTKAIDAGDGKWLLDRGYVLGV